MKQIQRTVAISVCLVALSGLAQGAWVARPGEVKLYIVKRPIAVASTLSWSPIPAQVLAHYGAVVVDERAAYAIVQLPATEAESLVEALAGTVASAEIREDFDLLDFRSAPIDAREAEVGYPSPWYRAVPPTGDARDSYLIQFAAPPQPDWLSELRDAKVVMVDYLAQNAYRVLGTRDALERIAARLPIQLLRLDQPFHRVDERLRELQNPVADIAVSTLRAPEASDAIEFITGNSIEEIRPAEVAGDREVRRLVFPTAAIPQLAAFPTVIWIEPYVPAMPSGEREAHLVAGDTLVSNAGNVLKPITGNYRSWISSKGVSGYKTAVKVAILDTGFDIGSATDVHKDFLGDSTASFVTPVNYTNHSDPNNDCYGHGTMVAGTIAGNAGGPFSSQTVDGSHPGDASFLMGLGVAPAVTLVSGRIFNYFSFPTYDPKSWTTIYGDLSTRGVAITNNSWNSTDTSYTLDAQTLDRVVRHTNGTDSGAPMAIYFSGGQKETGPGGRVTQPATAKNVVSVGGSENFNLNTYTDPNYTFCCTSGTYSDNGNQIWPNANFGPTQYDGRFKPDVVAPATAMESPRTRNAMTGCTVNADSVGALLDPGSPVNQQHRWSRGTSFSSPTAAGAGALLFTWFKNRNAGAAPSPAMLKAMQINFASDLPYVAQAGEPVIGHPWDPYQGWGKADLTRAFQTDGRYIWEDQNSAHILTPSNQIVFLPSLTGRYTIKDTSRVVRVTLVWSDRFGATGTGTELQNDVDLYVGSGTTTAFCVGNDINHSTGRSNVYFGSGGTNDHKNNVEEVIFNSSDLGTTFYVEVFGRTIVGDGINQWSGSTSRQDFAIFIDNVVGN